jgi:hypothetical protein
MAEQPRQVVIPYARFLEYRQRRLAVAGDQSGPQPPTTETDTRSAADHLPEPVINAVVSEIGR